MSDVSQYRNNLNLFLETITGAYIQKIEFHEDLNPADDIYSLQLAFKYCLSVSFYTDKGNFKLITSMTDSAIETFYVLPLEGPIEKTSEILINSKVQYATTEDGYDSYVYKIILQFEQNSLVIYAAEIYDTNSGGKDIKINDEMLLVFDSKSEADKFQQIINYA